MRLALVVTFAAVPAKVLAALLKTFTPLKVFEFVRRVEEAAVAAEPVMFAFSDEVEI